MEILFSKNLCFVVGQAVSMATDLVFFIKSPYLGIWLCYNLETYIKVIGRTIFISALKGMFALFFGQFTIILQMIFDQNSAITF